VGEGVRKAIAEGIVKREDLFSKFYKLWKRITPLTRP
jgi:hypothetical protein